MIIKLQYLIKHAQIYEFSKISLTKQKMFI